MFLGREKELANLEKYYAKSGFQLAIIYGRRRIGKTTLIREFVKDKRSFLFSAEEANDYLNLTNFSAKIQEFFTFPTSMPSFKSWSDAFSWIAQAAKNERIVIVMDEYPYAALANKSLNSMFQHVIDHELKATNLFIILCGSHVGFMENEILGSKSPLFGRRTTQMKILPMDYYDSAKFIKNATNKEKIAYYSCIGGTPYYLERIDKNLSFKENMKELFFDISGYLYDEPMMLLQQELREPTQYNTIIHAIASGCVTLNEIYQFTEIDKNVLSKYLKVLIDLKIVERIYPYGSNSLKNKNGQYMIVENFFRFWYRFVFANRGAIEGGQGEVIAEGAFNYLSNFIGEPAFEIICRQYLNRLNEHKKLPFVAGAYEKWWGKDKLTGDSNDIDIVVSSAFDDSILLGKCKWKSQLKHVKEINKLLQKDRLILGKTSYYHYFFSKIHYSKEAQKIAEKNKFLTLVTLDDLFSF